MAKNNKNQIEVEPVTNSCLGKRHVGPSGGLQNINIEYHQN